MISVEEPCQLEVVRTPRHRHFGIGGGQKAEQNSLTQKQLFEGGYRHGAARRPAVYLNIIGGFAKFD